ncbi:MAG: hypothetical protein J6Q53_07265 [Oscillospiraceae bacterium]|nr:hypothetical protein [Oscillospiraceae bacterium]
MAMLQKTVNGDFDTILRRVTECVLNGSMSATLEDQCDYRTGVARCSVRVFERYSYLGGNRVSMNVTLFQSGNGPVELCAITSGGSQALFFKVNTLGEESFLATLEELF